MTTGLDVIQELLSAIRLKELVDDNYIYRKSGFNSSDAAQFSSKNTRIIYVLKVFLLSPKEREVYIEVWARAKERRGQVKPNCGLLCALGQRK